jgi:hypothetical protein
VTAIHDDTNARDDHQSRGRSYVTSIEAEEAKRNLLWIAGKWPDLQARLTPGTGKKLDAVRGAPESRPPIDVHVSDLMRTIEDEAQMLAHVLMDETDWEPPTSTMPGLLEAVADRYGHFTTADANTALKFTDWAHEYQYRVDRCLTRPAPPEYIGPCPTPACIGELYLPEKRRTTTCPECGQERTIEDQRAWIEDQFKDFRMTQSEIVSALVVLGLPVPIGTVKSWTHRNRLMEGEDGKYSLQEAKTLAEGRKVRAS